MLSIWAQIGPETTVRQGAWARPGGRLQQPDGGGADACPEEGSGPPAAPRDAPAHLRAPPLG